MKVKVISVIVLYALSSMIAEAQSDLNAYKYIIVPNKFEFQRFDDQYQLNSLTEFLFKKAGFNTLKIDDRPNDLYDNSCLGLNVGVVNNSSMFTTKVVIELVDCMDKVVYKSEEGRSKLKDYKKGYHEAVRRAFESIKAIDYSYDSSKAITNNQNEVKPEEPIVNQPTKTDPPIVVAPVIPTVAVENAIEVNKDPKTAVQVKDSTVVAPVTVNEQNKVETTVENILYAQATEFGYQLVDNTPKVVFILLKSTRENYYFLKNKSGVVFKENEKWIAEYYKENKLIKQELKIKF